MEVWKDIEGYENYQVSNYGRVKSLKFSKERILKPEKNNGGYLYVFLSKNCIEKRYYIHRLVAQAFIVNPDGLKEINHKNEVKTDNRVENLEWCDRKYNNTYGTCIKRRIEKLSKTVYQYSLNNKLIREWSSSHEVERQTKFAQSHINGCCNGRLKTAYGYKWSYIKEPQSN